MDKDEFLLDLMSDEFEYDQSENEESNSPDALNSDEENSMDGSIGMKINNVLNCIFQQTQDDMEKLLPDIIEVDASTNEVDETLFNIQSAEIEKGNHLEEEKHRIQEIALRVLKLLQSESSGDKKN